ncbi:hypothetical protein Tco_1268359 [Tanacetum coccineum]
MEENDDGFTEVKSRKKKKGADFNGIRLNKPKSTVMWQQKKGGDAKGGSKSASPCVSTNDDGNRVSNPELMLILFVDEKKEGADVPRISNLFWSSADEALKEYRDFS